MPLEGRGELRDQPSTARIRHEAAPGRPVAVSAAEGPGYVFVTVPQLLAPGKAEPGAVHR
ncbi:hypothetical protein [Streptomyces tendae]|uniref:Uncharacterized protein n=1 Tax=Streptomyces tendae TaxID=1932 RepID=A0ABX5ZPW7_STRTE|nr:hypothetical protein [Streptomyces tendae]QER86704.1 hypothetical protein F3L20_13065 [Streptomyces tendae]